jgi:diguanylate cyclase (GGDEF)-like protein/PAS domain S-box-containing protein
MSVAGGGSPKVIRLTRQEPPGASPADAPHPGIHRRLARQLREATAEGAVDLDRLLGFVSQAYDETDEERRGIVRSMQLMSEEARELTREIRDESTTQLQSILDHVKDVILTVDDHGLIDTFNPTGERVFGYLRSEVYGRPLAYLLPDFGEERAAIDRLDQLAQRADDTHLDLAAHETVGRTKEGERFAAELAVSKARVERRNVYILCLRDATERKIAESANRESEARYRLLVENAPEAIVVLDVDRGCFVDCNRHAEEFFRMERPRLLTGGPVQVSPEFQADGSPSFGVARGYIDRALAGETPVFDWLHRDADGRDIPCEVRLARLPSATRRLIRGSVTDISERKRAELIAAGERRVLERLASNTGLDEALEAITELVERVRPATYCCIRVLDPSGSFLEHVAGGRLPREYCVAMDRVPVGPRAGSCAAAVYLARQVIVADIGKDPHWEHRRETALRQGLRSAWSTPIKSSDGALVGTFAVYQNQPGTPSGRDFELMARATQLAGIAIERRRAEEALKDSEARYRSLFTNVVEGVYQTNAAGKLLTANPALLAMMGFDSLEEACALGNVESLYVRPEDRAVGLARLLADGEIRNYEFQLRRRDGRLITVRQNARVVRDVAGLGTIFEGTLSDVTERKQAELAVLEEKERAVVTLQSIGDAVITTDANGIIDYINPVAEQLTGWGLDEARGKGLEAVLKVVNEATHEEAQSIAARCLREGIVIHGSDQAALIDRLGREVSIQNSAAPIKNRAGQHLGAVVVFRDVSRERRLRRALSYQATHDALTGLINRREFEQRLHAAVADVHARPASRHALVYLDLDQFKVVNDTCGHPAGDRLLKQITGLLQARVRASDTLARLGGDEFGILLKECGMEQALKISEGLRQAIREFRFEGADQSIQLGASIGVVSIEAATESVAGIMSAVDVACYAAKEQGRNRVHVYHQDNVPEAHREMKWVSRLQRACDDSRLELFFQPIVAIGAKRDGHGHYELVLRMRDEAGALVQPIEFIPAAERYNVMPAIDRWVVRRALDTLVRRGGPDAGYTIAINLSGTTLNDERFLDFLISELSTVDLKPGALCFEITETAAIANLNSVVYFMRELKSRGVSFALDDFGVGLSSFSYLRNLPVDFLKIDGQFVENVGNDPVDRSMVEAICKVARAMGIKTIAERVESAEVLAILASLGVDYAQGFFIAQPLPIHHFPHVRIDSNTTSTRLPALCSGVGPTILEALEGGLD